MIFYVFIWGSWIGLWDLYVVVPLYLFKWQMTTCVPPSPLHPQAVTHTNKLTERCTVCCQYPYQFSLNIWTICDIHILSRFLQKPNANLIYLFDISPFISCIPYNLLYFIHASQISLPSSWQKLRCGPKAISIDSQQWNVSMAGSTTRNLGAMQSIPWGMGQFTRFLVGRRGGGRVFSTQWIIGFNQI